MPFITWMRIMVELLKSQLLAQQPNKTRVETPSCAGSLGQTTILLISGSVMFRRGRNIEWSVAAPPRTDQSTGRYIATLANCSSDRHRKYTASKDRSGEEAFQPAPASLFGAAITSGLPSGASTRHS